MLSKYSLTNIVTNGLQIVDHNNYLMIITQKLFNVDAKEHMKQKIKRS